MKRVINIFITLIFCAALNFAQGSTVWFTALDKQDAFYGGLTASDIEIKDGKTALQINKLTARTDMPLEVVLMIDGSLSQHDVMQGARDIAMEFLDSVLNERTDKVAIVRFSDSISTISELTSNFKSVKASLKLVKSDFEIFEASKKTASTGVQVNDKKKRGNEYSATLLWKSLRDAIDAQGPIKNYNTRRAIVVVTNGFDTEGDKHLKSAVESSLRNQVPVYTISLQNDIASVTDLQGEAYLTQFAADTGGSAIIPVNKKRSSYQVDLTPLRERLRNYYEVEITNTVPTRKDPITKLDFRLNNETARKAKVKIVKPRGFLLN